MNIYLAKSDLATGDFEHGPQEQPRKERMVQ